MIDAITKIDITFLTRTKPSMRHPPANGAGRFAVFVISVELLSGEWL